MNKLEIGVGFCNATFGKEFNKETTQKINNFADKLGKNYDDAFKLATLAEEKGEEYLGGGRVGQYFYDYYMLGNEIIEVQQYSSDDNTGKSMGFIVTKEDIEKQYIEDDNYEWGFLEYILNKLEN